MDRTDLQVMVDMLSKAGIDFSIYYTEKGATINIEEGYPGFYSEMTFDKDEGSLMSIKAWE